MLAIGPNVPIFALFGLCCYTRNVKFLVSCLPCVPMSQFLPFIKRPATPFPSDCMTLAPSAWYQNRQPTHCRIRVRGTETPTVPFSFVADTRLSSHHSAYSVRGHSALESMHTMNWVTYSFMRVRHVSVLGTLWGAMRQRKLGSHTPPCHGRMIITTLFSVLLAALQRRPVLYHTRWLLAVHWHWFSGH